MGPDDTLSVFSPGQLLPALRTESRRAGRLRPCGDWPGIGQCHQWQSVLHAPPLYDGGPRPERRLSRWSTTPSKAIGASCRAASSTNYPDGFEEAERSHPMQCCLPHSEADQRDLRQRAPGDLHIPAAATTPGSARTNTATSPGSPGPTRTGTSRSRSMSFETKGGMRYFFNAEGRLTGIRDPPSPGRVDNSTASLSHTQKGASPLSRTALYGSRPWGMNVGSRPPAGSDRSGRSYLHPLYYEARITSRWSSSAPTPRLSGASPTGSNSPLLKEILTPKNAGTSNTHLYQYAVVVADGRFRIKI